MTDMTLCVWWQVARVYEKVFGRCGDLHFCVTDAMRLWLRDNFGELTTNTHSLSLL